MHYQDNLYIMNDFTENLINNSVDFNRFLSYSLQKMNSTDESQLLSILSHFYSDFCQSEKTKTNEAEKIQKVKLLLNSLRGEYVSIDNIGKLLQHALQDKYSLENFQLEIKGFLFSTDLEQENNKLKSEVNELIHELKKLRRMQWDKKPINALKYANEKKFNSMNEFRNYAKNSIKSYDCENNNDLKNSNVYKMWQKFYLLYPNCLFKVKL